MNAYVVNSTNYDQYYCKDPSQCLKKVVDGKLQCKCGEDVDLFDWSWEVDNPVNVKLSETGREVLFHPVYSSGTATVKGNAPFKENYHYYWEIKIISVLYGTNVMIGVGTSKVVLSDYHFKFCNLLGIDTQSWGYSYHGNIQHDQLRRKYGKRFGRGSIVGVHLDMCQGTLEYFLNRKSLGIAFRDLKGKELYPMVCSTAAQSAIRMTCCMSKESTLQMQCVNTIMQNPSVYQQYRKVPGLTRVYDKQFFWMQLQPEVNEKKRLADLDEDVTLSLVSDSPRSKKFRYIRLVSSLLFDDDLFYDDDSDDNSNTENEGTSSRESSEDSTPSGSQSSNTPQETDSPYDFCECHCDECLECNLGKTLEKGDSEWS